MPKPSKERILNVGAFTYVPLADDAVVATPAGPLPQAMSATSAKLDRITPVEDLMVASNRVSTTEELLRPAEEESQSSCCCWSFFGSKKKPALSAQADQPFQQKLMR